MSQSIEWAYADNNIDLVLGDEEAPDGQTPDENELESGNIALVIEGCALYGKPAELLDMLSRGVSLVSAHLAGQS